MKTVCFPPRINHCRQTFEVGPTQPVPPRTQIAGHKKIAVGKHQAAKAGHTERLIRSSKQGKRMHERTAEFLGIETLRYATRNDRRGRAHRMTAKGRNDNVDIKNSERGFLASLGMTG